MMSAYEMSQRVLEKTGSAEMIIGAHGADDPHKLLRDAKEVAQIRQQKKLMGG
jgi:hypothetical protein